MEIKNTQESDLFLVIFFGIFMLGLILTQHLAVAIALAMGSVIFFGLINKLFNIKYLETTP